MAEAVAYNLKKAGIDADIAGDGEEGLDMAVQPIYDCVVLDIMLPKLSGLDVLRTLRKRNIKTPVIMLSALSEVDDKITGLDLGADDYLAKPFKTAELVARINAVVRRPRNLQSKIIKYKTLQYDTSSCTLNGLELTARESAILELFLAAPEKIIAKQHILAKVWGGGSYASENSLEVYVSHLRKKLKSVGGDVQIKTIKNLGYKLCFAS